MLFLFVLQFHGIMALIPPFFRTCLLQNDLTQAVKHSESILEMKRKLKNRKMQTVLVFYVDEIINKVFIVFCWFLLTFVSCKHQQKAKV